MAIKMCLLLILIVMSSTYYYNVVSFTSENQTPVLSLNLDSRGIRKEYDGVINKIREAVASGENYYGIPVMRPPWNPAEYIILNLTAKRGPTDITLSLAINKTNLYVSGYADPSTKKAFFFEEVMNEKTSIFPGGDQLKKEKIVFKSGYGGNRGLEGKSGLFRVKLVMSLSNLLNWMLAVQGKDYSKRNFDADQAKFLLYCTQAFSEAARFKYLQNKFNRNQVEIDPKPLDYKVVALENDWQTISSRIKTAIEGKLISEIKLKNVDDTDWIVHTVAEIKPYMGILLYVPDKAQYDPRTNQTTINTEY